MCRSGRGLACWRRSGKLLCRLLLVHTARGNVAALGR